MERDITIQLADVALPGLVIEPATRKGLVIFVHGAGSNHDSPRNRRVAEALSEAGYVCVMFDLLTEEEYGSEDKRLDMSLMSKRLFGATEWVSASDFGREQRIGYFGSSTGSAVAFKALNAGERNVSAVVSRGGRPDLVLSDLRKVTIPSLLVVGGEDYKVRLFNERALEQLKGPRELRIVPEAGHLFEEPGTMEQVSDLARDWFDRYLAREQEA